MKQCLRHESRRITKANVNVMAMFWPLLVTKFPTPLEMGVNIINIIAEYSTLGAIGFGSLLLKCYFERVNSTFLRSFHPRMIYQESIFAKSVRKRSFIF